MDLRTLRAFVEVVRQGGFSSAAKTVFASQPTISKAVKQLEDEIGAPLLMRIGRGVQLTEAGRIVYTRAIAMLSERDHLKAEIAELRGLKRGTLRIGLPPVGSSILFAPLFAEFRLHNPGIDILLQEHGSARLEELVLAGEIDLCASLLPVSDIYDHQEVCDEPMVALLPPGHALAGRKSVRLKELADSPFVLFESGFTLNSMIKNACRKHGFEPEAAAYSSQTDFIAALVAAGLGVALLPRLVASQSVNPAIHLALVDEPDLRWRLAMIWRRGGYLSPSVRAWLDLTEEYARRGGRSSAASAPSTA